MGLPLFASAPNRSKFEALFAAGGANLSAATGKLDRLMRGWPDEPGLRDEIKALEEEGDRITHDILHALYSTTVTPLDREDIHGLASARSTSSNRTSPLSTSSRTRATGSAARRWSRCSPVGSTQWS